MNAGLVYLLRKRPVRAWRALRRKFRGVRGALAILAIGAFVALLLGPQLFLSATQTSQPYHGEDIRTFAPPLLLAFAVLSIVLTGRARGALYFRPEEIDQLFPAPVTRRALLLYHVVSRLLVQVLSALWVSLFVARYAGSFLGCLAGTFLALAMLQIVVQTALLLAALLGARLARLARIGLGVVLLALLGLSAYTLREEVRAAEGLWAAVRVLVSFAPVQVLSAPFVPVANAFAATAFIDVVAWSAVSLLVVGALLLLMTRFDAAYEEAALDASRTVQQKLRRMRSGAGAWGAAGPKATRFSVPRFPRLEGAGAIAWRQALAMLRNRRAIIGVALFLTLWPLLFGGVLMASAEPGEMRNLLKGLIPAVIFMGALSTQNLPFDFRRDADRLDTLKSLPLRSAAIATGEIAPAALLVAGMTGVISGALAVVSGLLSVALVPLLCVAIVPFTWAVVALDNAIFMIMPQRFEPDEAANLGFMGTTMFVTMIKMFALFVVLGFGGAAGAAVYWPTGSVAVGVATGVVAICLADIALTWLVAWLFERHDPSQHRPA